MGWTVLLIMFLVSMFLCNFTQDEGFFQFVGVVLLILFMVLHLD